MCSTAGAEYCEQQAKRMGLVEFLTETLILEELKGQMALMRFCFQPRSAFLPLLLLEKLSQLL